MKTLFASVATAAAIFAGSAFAQATVEINDSACAVPDANAVLWIISPPALGGDAVVQRVTSGSGNTKTTCNGTLPEGAALPDRGAVVTSEFLCAADGVLTTDSHAVVTRSGRVALTCHFNAQ